MLTGMSERLEALETAPRHYIDPDSFSQVCVDLRGLVDALERFEKLSQNNAATIGSQFQTIADQIEEIQNDREDLVLAISEGIERTDRAERRVQGSIRRARKELKSRGYEDPGLEAEAREFSNVDENGSQPSELPDVPAPVEPDGDAPSSVRGVSIALLQRLRGF